VRWWRGDEDTGVDDRRRQVAERARQVEVTVCGGGEAEVGLVVAEAEPEEWSARRAAAGRRRRRLGARRRRAALAVRRAPAVDDERHELQLETARRRHLHATTSALRYIKAKFHYASWFGAGSEPASVMEFGFYIETSTVRNHTETTDCALYTVFQKNSHFVLWS